MSLDFKNLPQELKLQGKFCIWKSEKKGKMPYDPTTHKYAKCNDSSTFTDYNTAVGTLTFEEDEDKCGLGFGLFNGYSAININNCILKDGKPNDYAMDIINYCKSYTELSPSKKGITIIVKSNNIIANFDNYNLNGKMATIMVADNTNKYVTITADEMFPNNVTEVDLKYLLDKYFAKSEIVSANATQSLVIKAFEETDTGNARFLIERFGANLRYNYENKQWMLFNGKYWQYDYTDKVKRLVELLVEEMQQNALKSQNESFKKHAKKSGNRGAKENMLVEARHLEGVAVLNSDLDKNKILFNCKNGTVNLKSGEITKHNKIDLISKYSDVNYTPNSYPTRFMEFLEDIIGDFDEQGQWQADGEKINYLQKIMGYSLTGLTNEQCMFFLIGNGSNGKSVLMDILQNIIGEYGAIADKDLLIDKKMQNSNASQVARLDGRRLCLVGETEEHDKLKEAFVKSMTGGSDKLVGKFLYANEFEFTPEFKIFMMSNYEPNISGTDDGIWRRIILLKFNRKFNDNEKDINLTTKLLAERDAIFTWMVEGAMEVLKDGLGKPDFVKKEVEKYRSDMDQLESWIDERCVRVAGSKTYIKELYANYCSWCKETNVHMKSQPMWSKQMLKKFNKNRITGGYIYYGIEIKGGVDNDLPY